MCKDPVAREITVCWKKRQQLSGAGSWNRAGDWEVSGLGHCVNTVSFGSNELPLS